MQVKNLLLVDQRLIHIQETVKQVKEFVVQTIQFRNTFDTEGPLVPGLTPTEAVSRVGERKGEGRISCGNFLSLLVCTMYMYVYLKKSSLFSQSYCS